MQEVKKVAVNVVLSDALAYLPNFFASLEAQEPKDFSIIMIDNASEDGAAKWVQDLYADVTVLRNFRNQGFARAANQAVELAWSRWPKENWADRFILMIDPAIELGANCLFHLTQILERDSSLTAVCPKILQTRVKSVAEDGRREVEHTDILYATGLFIDKFRRAVCRGEGERDRGFRQFFSCSRKCKTEGHFTPHRAHIPASDRTDVPGMDTFRSSRRPCKTGTDNPCDHRTYRGSCRDASGSEPSQT